MKQDGKGIIFHGNENQVRYPGLGDKIADAFKTGMAFRQTLEDTFTSNKVS